MKITVELTQSVFRRFAWFDMLKRRKMWRSPMTFAAIMCSCAAVCFWMSHVQGALLLGTVLSVVGLGMPLVYFANFTVTLNRKILQLGLSRPQYAYTLELTTAARGICVSNQRENAVYAWKDVHHVYRDRLATYLFITLQQGFIIPHTCLDGSPDELWSLIHKMLSKEKYSQI